MGCRIRKWQGKSDPLYEEGWTIVIGGLRPIVKNPPAEKREKTSSETKRRKPAQEKRGQE